LDTIQHIVEIVNEAICMREVVNMASEKVLYKAEDGTLINLSTKVINNTTTDSTTDALSAAQGKVLASKFTTLTKSSVGLGNVDNTADSAKTVKAATKLQTYKAGSTTETYGDEYPFYVQWQSDNTLKLTCDGYKTRVDIADSALPLSGGTLSGQVNFGSSSYYVKADGTANFKTVTGAVYNDYAEFFPRGEATEPGDIVALDLSSDHESYIKATATSKIVAGVHSDEYAMLIGGDKVDDGNYVEKNIEKYIPVSLCGRVFCKCVGKIHRGDTIVVSDIPGIGRAKLPNDYVENTQIVGYAVDEDMNEEIRRVRIRVKG
jgi:hypothetical protein